MAALSVGFFGFMFLLLSSGAQQAQAATSSNLNFQARLLSNTGAVVADGNYNIEFKIYNDISAGGQAQGTCSGNCLWVETRVSTDKVRVVNGYFSVNLGSVTAFSSTMPWDQTLYFTMRIGGSGSPGWEASEMTNSGNRMQLTGVPYAFRAGTLAKYNGTQTGTLAFNTVVNSPVITLPDATGTVCLQSASACGFAASTIDLQGVYANSTTPATITTSSGTKTILIRAGSAFDSASLLQVQNAAGNQVFTVDTSAGQVVLGKPGGSGLTGILTFNNATNSNTASIQSGTTSSSYTLTLPTALPGSTQCLSSTSGGALGFSACSGGSATLASVYTNGSSQTDSTIALDSTRLGVIIKDNSTPISGSLLTVQNSGGTTKYLDVSSSKIALGEDIVATAVATGTTATTSGTGTNTTTVTLTGSAFANGDVIFIDNAGQDYYTRITAGGGTSTLTVSPAVTFETARTVTKYTIQNVGATATDYTTLANRFFQGYFLGGIVTGAGSTSYSDANITSATNLRLNTVSGVNVQGTNSATAFAVQDSAGTSNLFIANTSTNRIGIGATPANGLLTVGTNTTTAAGGIYLGTDTNLYRATANVLKTDSSLNFGATTTAQVDATVGFFRGAGVTNLANTGSYLEIDNTLANTAMFKQRDAAAVVLVVQGASSQSANLFQLQTSTAATVLGVGSTGVFLSKNSADSTTAFQVQPASSSTPVLNADTSNSRIGINTAAPGTSLTVSQASTASLTTIQQTIPGNAIQIVSTYGAGGNYLPGLIWSTSDNSSTHPKAGIWVQANSFGSFLNFGTSNNYSTGVTNTALSINQSGGSLFKPGTDQATTFQVQNAAAANIFTVDTSITPNLITNGDLEGGTTTGWTAKGSSTITQSNAHQWQGNNALSVATTTAADDGAYYNYTFGATTQYTLSLYAKLSGGSITDVNIGRQDNGSDIDCLSGQTVSNNWTRFSCTFTTGGTISGSNIYIKKTGSSAETFYIDGIQLQTGASTTAFNSGGALQLGGYVNSPITFQNRQNSTTAFQIQNGAGTGNLFIADTLNNRIGIGTSAPQQALTLGTGNNFAVNMSPPTGVSSALAAGGSLTVAQPYYYVLTALESSGGQTVQSAETTKTPTSGNQKISLSWTAPTGAQSYKIYRSTTSGSYGASSLLTAITCSPNPGCVPAVTYTDDGTVSLTSGTPPSSTTAYVNKLSASGNSWFTGGNLGIGTSNPSQALTVVGDQAWFHELGDTGALGGIYINPGDSSTSMQEIHAYSGSLKGLRLKAETTAASQAGFGQLDILESTAAQIAIAGTLRNTGGLTVMGLGTIAAPTVVAQGTTGATTWGYKITARTQVGETLPSTETQIANGNATLSGSDFNRITWTWVAGAKDYQIYRTTAGGTPNTTGLIGTVSTSGTVGSGQLDDTGLSATTAAPAIDTSGYLGIGTTAPGSALQLGSSAGTAASGITFGSTGDTTLYRSAADTLKTDDKLLVQTATNSTTAFAVQNSAGSSVLTADTTNLNVSVSNLSTPGTISISGSDGGSILLRAAANSGIGGSNPMTFSGNEITDVTRATRLQGDGRAPSDSSTGIWEGTTNLVKNGGIETDSTSHTTQAGSGTVNRPRDTTTSKFGVASIKITNDGTAVQGSIWWDTAGAHSHIPVSASTTYTFSAWVKGTTGSEALALGIRWYDNTGAQIGATVLSNFTATTSFTRYTMIQTSPSNATEAVVQTVTQGSTAYTWWVDGVQFEQKPTATPYVETNGSTAARSASRVQAPASVLSTTQGWVAFRARVGWNSSTLPTTFMPLFEWDNDSSHGYLLAYTNTGLWIFEDINGSVVGPSISQSQSIGDIVTVVAKWTGTSASISVNGSAFTTTTGLTLPTITNSQFDFGRALALTQGTFDGDILWSATGTGTLSDADAASINRFSNSDPSLSSLNSTATSSTATLAWDGQAKSYSGTNNVPTLQSGITIDDVNLYHSSNGALAIQGSVNSATALQVQNAAGNQVFTVDTSAGQVVLGKPGGSGLTGILTFNNATNSNTASIQSGTTSSSYTLTLPTALPGSTQCLQSTNTGTLLFASCAPGSGTLASTYANGSSQTDSTIALDSTRLGVIIKDNSTPISGSLLTVQNSGGTTKYLDVSSSKIALGEDIVATAVATGTTATTSGTGTNTTTVTLTGSAFANGDVIFIDNAGQDYYTRITAGGGTSTLTVSPAVTFETARTVTKYTIQNVGATATDYTTLANRFFQGYFLGGIVTGAGSTSYSDANITSATNLRLNTVSGVNVQGTNSATAFTVASSDGTSVLAADTNNLQLNVGNLQGSGTVSLQNGGASILLRTALASGTGLTVSGNEITDVTRSADKQGDGRNAPDSSTGIWESTTNLVKNSGAETDVTSHITGPGTGGSRSRDTAIVKFGSASFKNTTDGTGANQGTLWWDTAGANSHIPVSSNTVYTASAWVKGSTGTEALNIVISWYDNTGTSISISTTSFTATSGFARYSVTGTSPANATQAVVRITTQGTSAYTWWVDGVQLEQKAAATPYVETNGATATRSAARVQGTATNNLNSSQGWVAMRLRMGFSSSQTSSVVSNNGGASLRLFQWLTDSSNRILLVLQSSNTYSLVRQQAGSGNGAVSSVQSFNAGDLVTLIGAWDGSNNYFSINGGTFTSTANTAAPSLPTTFDIGSLAGAAQMDLDSMWFASGTGTLSDADAASINRYGNSDPTLSTLSTRATASAPSLVWDGENKQYTGLDANPVAQSGLTLDDSTLYRNNTNSLAVNSSFLVQPTINSSTAFQIQNAIGSAAFVADTTPLNTLINNGSVEGSDVSNWASKQNATVTRDTTQQYIGSASAKVVLGGSPAANDGVKYTPSPALAATGYVVSFSIKQTAGTAFGTNLAVGWNNGSDTDCSLSPSLAAQAVPTTGWARYSCSFTGSTGGTDHLYWKQTDAPGSARTFFIDAVQVETGSTASAFKETGLSLNGVINSPVVFKNVNDSTSAFQIQNAAGTSSLFVADTVNNRIGIGTAAPSVQFEIKNGSSYLQFNPAGNSQIVGGLAGGSFQLAAGSWSNGNITLSPYGAGGTLYLNYGGLTNGNGGVKIYDGGVTTQVASISGTGAALFQNSANSTSAFQIQNAAGSNVFVADTTPINAIITNPSFETNANGWTYSGASGGSVTQITTQQYIGSGSLRVISGTTATANDGAKYVTGSGAQALAVSTGYSISWYDKLSSGTLNTLVAAYDRDGSGGGSPVDCTGIYPPAVSTTGWTHHICYITTDATTPAADAYLLIRQGDTTNRTFYIDAFQIENAASATPFKETGLTLNGVISSPVALRSPSNSTTAFQIQDSSGFSNLFIADTLNNRIGIGTFAPTAKLDLVDASGNNIVAVFRGTSSSTGQNSGGSSIGVTNINSTNGNQESLVFADAGGQTIAAIMAYNTDQTNHSGDLAFGTRNSGTYGETLRLYAAGSAKFSGQVGIGQIVNSGAALQVRTASDGATSGGFNVFPTDFNSGTATSIQVGQAATSTQGLDILSRSSGTGNILSGIQLRNDQTIHFLTGDSAVEVAKIGSDGSILFKNATNSTTAFAVQNSAGSSVLTADTTNLNVSVSNLSTPGTISISGSDGGSILLRAAANSGIGGSNPMTFSGNEITDVTRATRLQGDGRAPLDSSTGIWEGTTNLVTNGGLETNTTGWNTSGSYWTNAGASISRDTANAKFGSASLKVVTPGSSAAEGTYTAFSVTSGQTYTFSAWLKGSGTVHLAIGDGSVGSTSGSNITLTNTWTKYSVALTASGTGSTYGAIAVPIGSTSALTYYVDGVQVENKVLATPYVETNGSTAARSASRVQAPASVLSTTQGWVAFRARVGWDSSTLPSTFMPLYEWGNDISHAYLLSYTGGLWYFEDINGSVAGPSIAQSQSKGDLVTVVAKWTGTSASISVNGSAFTTTTGLTLPTITNSQFDIGSGHASTTGTFDGDILWSASGTGTLSNADAASINRFSNSDPSLSSLNSTATSSTATLAWDGQAKSYSGTNNVPTLQSGITLDDSTLYRNNTNSLAVNSSFLVQPTIDSTTAFQVQNSIGNNYLQIDTVGAVISVGNTSIASTIQIGNTVGAVSQNIYIGSNSTASSTTNTNIGSSIAGTTAITGLTTITNRTSGSADTFNVSNSTSTGTIANFKDNASTVFSLADGGAALFQNQTNSATAFQVQNSTGVAVENISTTTTNLLLDGSFEVAIPSSTWALKGSASISRVTGVAYSHGTYALSVVTTTAAGDGVKYPIQLANSTNYTFTFQVKLLSGSFTDLVFGYANDGSTETNFVSPDKVVTTDSYTSFSYNFTTNTTNNSNAYLFIKQRTAPGAGRTFYIDAAHIETGCCYVYSEGATTFLGNVGIGTSTSSVNANLHVVQASRTEEGAVLIEAMSHGLTIVQTHDWLGDASDTVSVVHRSTGDGVIVTNLGGAPQGYAGTPGGNSAFNAFIPYYLDTTGDGWTGSVVNDRTGMRGFYVQAQAQYSQALLIGNYSSKAAIEIYNQSGAHPTFDGSGILLNQFAATAPGIQIIRNGSGTGNPLDIRNASNSLIASVSPYGLIAGGTPIATQVGGLKLAENYSLNMTANANCNSDAFLFQNATITTGDCGSNAQNYKYVDTAATFGSRGIKFAFSGDDTAGLMFYADRAASTAGSTFTPTLRMIVANSGNVGIGEAAPSALLHVAGTGLFKNATNSSTAFQIQNAIGSAAFVADTTPLNTLINNGSVEGSDVSNWASKQNATVTRDTTQQYIGSASAKVVLGGSPAANDGVKYTPSPALAATGYVVSFSIKQTAGTAFGTNLAVGWNNGSDTNCTLSPTLTAQPIPTTGWARYSCTFTGSTTGTHHLYWKQTDAPGSARTFFIDAVQVETGSTASAFKDTGISLNGVINSPVVFKNVNDSTTAFQVQNSSGNNYLLVDTVGAIVSVGNTGIASTVQIGNTTGAVTQTINIGNNTTASSTSTVVVGSLQGASATTIQGGSGGITLNGNTSLSVDKSLSLVASAASNIVMNVKVSGDSSQRLTVAGDGKLTWTGGFGGTASTLGIVSNGMEFNTGRLSLRADTNLTTVPELHYLAQLGQWSSGIDVSGAIPARDFVPINKITNRVARDVVTTNASTTITSASEAGFSPADINLPISGTGIPETTTTGSLPSNCTGTTIGVVSASGWPTSGNYGIVIDAERMTVTAGQGTTTWTITRCVNGTASATHNSGAIVNSLITSVSVGNSTTATISVPATASNTITATIGNGHTGGTDLLYISHNGGLPSTFGLGWSQPDTSYRLQVAADPDNMPSMGGLAVHIYGGQTGKAIAVVTGAPATVWSVDVGGTQNTSLAGAGTAALNVQVAGESNPRWSFQPASIQIGSGSGAYDTAIKRTNTARLEIDNILDVASIVNVGAGAIGLSSDTIRAGTTGSLDATIAAASSQGQFRINMSGTSSNVTLQTSNASNITLDAGGAAAINVGNANANAINIGNGTVSTTAITGPTTITNRTSGSADTFNVSNSTSTGTIARFLDGGSANPVFSLADGGAALFQNQTNSSTAFQIQNAIGSAAFVADTTPLNTLINNGSVEGSDVSNWASKQNATVTRDTTQQYIGSASAKVVLGGSPAANDWR